MANMMVTKIGTRKPTLKPLCMCTKGQASLERQSQKNGRMMSCEHGIVCTLYSVLCTCSVHVHHMHPLYIALVPPSNSISPANQSLYRHGSPPLARVPHCGPSYRPWHKPPKFLCWWSSRCVSAPPKPRQLKKK